MTMKRFENRLNKNKIKFNVLNPVWDNKKEDALNVFEMIECLNALHEEKEYWKKLASQRADEIKETIKLQEELDYYKTKCGSLETALLQGRRAVDKEKEQRMFR